MQNLDAVLRDLFDRRVRFNSRSVAVASLLMGCGVQVRSEGWTVRDHRGRSFIDLFDAYGNQAFGYAHPRLVDTLVDTLRNGKTNSCKIFFDEPQIRLAERLASLTNGALSRSFLANGGAEAIDSALKLARAATRRPKFITAANAFHGKTFGAISASCRPEYEALYGPLLPEFVSVPFGDAAAMEAALGPDVAGVLLEPVQAEGGIRVADKAYFQSVRSLTERAGALLIFDEMQTGLGRTGSFFAFEELGVLPDIVCLGKSLGGGLVPISAVLSRAGLWTAVEDVPLSFGSSLGGNPLACTVALEAIDLASDPSFLAHVRRCAALVEERLGVLPSRYPNSVAAVRGLGLLHGVEFREPAIAGHALWLLNRRDVLSAFCLYDPTVLRVEPPLIISEEALGEALSHLEAAIAEADAFARQCPRDAVERSSTARSADIAAPAERVLERLAGRESAARYALLAERAAWSDDGLIHVQGSPDDVALQWVERVSESGGLVLREAVSGDWARLETTWRVTPAGDGACTVALSVAWDLGAGEFEHVLRLRLRASIERACEQTLERLRRDVQLASASTTEETRA